MFRASPWVSYPGPGNASSSSSAPASMDAPQIDTLQDDDPSSRPGPTTFDPPQNGDPPSPRTGRFRVKLLVSEKPSSKAGGQESVRDAKRASADGADMDVDVEADPERDGDDDEADEEDQLIDDDDDDAPTSSGPASTRPTPVPTKQPVVGHRGRPRGRPRGSGVPAAAGVKRKRAGAPDPAQPLEIRFEPFPGAPQGSAGEEASPAPKKRKTPKTKEKAPAPRKSAGSAAKTKTTITIPPLIDVAPADLSEGPTGTMPSSPIENVPPSPTPSSVTALPPSQSIADSSTNGTGEMPPTDGSPPDASAPNGPASLSESLKDTPLPRYPLPTRPFPVQAPPKIVTGYAPIIPLDRSKLAPRHWRPAQREIRGIAGGRWFVRSWVGDKESPLANASQQASPPQEPPLPTSISALTMPKLSAPPTIKKTKTSAASSRAESVQPPAGPTAASVKKKSGLSTAAVQAADDEAESVVSVDAVA